MLDSTDKVSANRPTTTVLCFVLFAVLVLLSYGRTFDMGFVFDDIHVIVQNPSVQEISRLPSLFQQSVWSQSGDDGSYYRPIVMASFLLDWVAWGGKASGFHLTNLVLHLLVTCLLFLLLARTLLDKRIALLAAALFAVHPVHSECVAWISGRTDVLATLFVLLALVLLPSSPKVTSKLSLAMSVCCFFLSLLCKEVAILLPVLVYWWMAGVQKSPRRSALLTTIPYLGTLLVYLGLRTYVLEATPLFREELLTHLATAPVLLSRHLGLTLWPHPQRVFYDLDLHNSLFEPVVIGSWLVLLLVAAALVWMRRSNARIFFFALFFPLFIFPVSGFVFFTRPALISERYLYLPSIATCVVLAWVLVALLKRTQASGSVRLANLTGIAVSIIILCGMLYQLNSYNEVWRDQRSFIARLVADAPESAMANNAMGVLQFSEGKYQDAIDSYTRSIKLNPLDCDVIFNRALAYKQTGKTNSAYRDLQRTLMCHPNMALAWFELGRLEMRRGNMRQAAEHFGQATKIEPGNSRYRAFLNRSR